MLTIFKIWCVCVVYIILLYINLFWGIPSGNYNLLVSENWDKAEVIKNQKLGLEFHFYLT